MRLAGNPGLVAAQHVVPTSAGSEAQESVCYPLQVRSPSLQRESAALQLLLCLSCWMSPFLSTVSRRLNSVSFRQRLGTRGCCCSACDVQALLHWRNFGRTPAGLYEINQTAESAAPQHEAAPPPFLIVCLPLPAWLR